MKCPHCPRDVPPAERDDEMPDMSGCFRRPQCVTPGYLAAYAAWKCAQCPMSEACDSRGICFLGRSNPAPVMEPI